MPPKKARFLWCIGAALLLSGCGSAQDSQRETAAQQDKEPSVIAVQHILIGFQGSVPGKPISRTREEAQALAVEIFEKAKAGADFDALVKKYTDDAHPGIYRMANFNVPADASKETYSRGSVVPAFGNVGFTLKPGEVGLANYDGQSSPYGWHIIKRIE